MSGRSTTQSTTTEKKGMTMNSNPTPEAPTMVHIDETTGGPTAAAMLAGLPEGTTITAFDGAPVSGTATEITLISIAEQAATAEAPIDVAAGAEVSFGWCPHRVAVAFRDDKGSLLSPAEFKVRCEAAASLATTLSLRAEAVDALEQLDDLIAELRETATGTPSTEVRDDAYAGADEGDDAWPPFGETFKVPA